MRILEYENSCYIYDDVINFGFNSEHELDPTKLYKLFYDFVQMSKEEREKMFGEKIPESSMKEEQLQYSFLRMSEAPYFYKSMKINTSKLVFTGILNENSGLYMLLQKYKKELEKI